MKFKHNKKRNTAFVFESIVREIVKSIIAEDVEKKKIVVSTLKKFFNKDKSSGVELYLEVNIFIKSSHVANGTNNFSTFSAALI